MDPDNAFNEIFGKKPSTEQKTEPQNSLEDTSAIKEQSEAVLQTLSVQQPMQEEHEPDTAEKPVRKRGRRRKGDVSAAEKPVRKRGRRRKGDVSVDGSTPDKVGHFSCICDKDLIAKVRAIAWQEHLTVRAVVESMFSKCIAKYEKKRGPILIEPSQPSEELF